MRRLIMVVASLLLSTQVAAQRLDTGPGAGLGYPFSEAARVGDLLFLSGQVGTDDKGELAPGGMVPEAHQIMQNIQGVLQRQGLSMKDVVKCTIFLADVAEWADFNKVYVTYFEKPYPARSALGANGLALGARLEVECMAAYPNS